MALSGGLWPDPSPCVKGGSMAACVEASTAATKANSQPQGAGKRGGGHRKRVFMNLCFSTNRQDGSGTRITEKLLHAKQKWNKR